MPSEVGTSFPGILRLRKGSIAVAEIQALGDTKRAWIAVYPLHAQKHLQHRGDYRVRVFDVERQYLADDNDVWEGVLESRADVYVTGEEQLVETIKQFVDPLKLGPPQDCEYPS